MSDDPQYPPCPDCAGHGTTAAREWVDAVTSLLLDLGDDVTSQRIGRDIHPYLANLPTRPYADHATRPSADALELSTGLAGRAPCSILGHDSCDCWHARDAIIRAAGLDPAVWGICQRCHGTGELQPEETPS